MSSRSVTQSGRRRRRALERVCSTSALGQDSWHLPFPDASFDAAVSTQVFEYIDDVPAALAEAYRVLARRAAPAARHRLGLDRVALARPAAHAPRARGLGRACRSPHLPRTLPGLIRDAGFTLIDTAVIPLFNGRYDPNTYSAGVIPLIAAFVTGRDGITADQARSWAQELTELDDRYFFSLNRYVFLATT